MERPGIGLFLQGLKALYPAADDTELVSLYDGLKATNDDPQKRQAVEEAFKAAQAAKVTQLQRVEVTGKRPTSTSATDAVTRIPVQQQLQSPLRGTTMEQRDPKNPQATLLNQFDPEAMKAAQAAYNSRYGDNQSRRNIGNIAYGAVAGFDQGAGLNRNNALYDHMNQEAASQTIGQVLQRQQAATAGLNAAQAQQNMDVTAQKAPLEVAASRQGLIDKTLGTEVAQRMQQADSPETLILKQLIIAQAATLPKQASNALRTILKENPDATAQQLMPILGQFAPQLQDSYLKMIGGQTAAAESRIKQNQAAISDVTTPMVTGGGNRVSPGVQQGRDNDALAILRQEATKVQQQLSKTPPGTPEHARLMADAAALAREMEGASKKAGVQMPPLAVTGIGADGQVAIAPQPGFYEAQAARNKTAQNWHTIGASLVNRALTMLDDPSMTGKGSKAIASLWPDNKRAELLTILSQIENTSPGMLPPELSKMLTRDPSGRAFAGQFDPSMTADQLKRLLRGFGESVRATIEFDPQKDGRPPTALRADTSPPRVSSKDEYDKLPKGARFIDARDGKLKEKP